MIRLARYLGVGAAAAAVDISLFTLFAVYLGYNYLVVGFCTFVLATAVNYVLSVRFVFQSGIRFARHHEVMLVFAISAVGLVLNQLMLYLGIGLLKMHPVLTKLAGTGVVFGWNYAARSRFVFRRPS
jgi:putative flippase GtrA